MSVSRVRLPVAMPLAAILIAALLLLAGTFGSPPATAETECPGDNDCDGFSNSIENHVGTDHKDACGPDAWPPDFNNDTFVDVIGDLALISGFVGQTVPPAPVRFDIAPEPEGDNAITGADLSRVAGLAFQSCGTP